MDFDSSPQFDIPTADDLQPRASKSKRAIMWAVIVLVVIALAVASALLVKHFVISTFIVDGISMYPTLDGGNGPTSEGDSYQERINGEVLYLNKVAKIKRGDIVVFTPDWGLLTSDGKNRTLVKRVIAVGGDRVQIQNSTLYLNGEAVDEPYINERMESRYDGVDFTIADGYIFCMGDNRNHSADCREYGPVSLDTVIGKCFLIKGINGKLRKPN